MRASYELAMKCFVVNGHLSETFKDAGDAANAQLFDQKAERAFKAANGFASFLRLSRAQIERDYDLATERELRRLMTDRAYLSAAITECKNGQLM